VEFFAIDQLGKKLTGLFGPCDGDSIHLGLYVWFNVLKRSKVIALSRSKGIRIFGVAIRHITDSDSSPVKAISGSISKSISLGLILQNTPSNSSE
jgi:hypothetical protein